MNKIIKALKVLGKLVVIMFVVVISFFGTALLAGVLQGLFGLNITFNMAVVIILMITIGTSILMFRKKEDYSIFIDIEEEEQEEEQEEEFNQVQSQELKTNSSVEEEYINHFGFWRSKHAGLEHQKSIFSNKNKEE